MCGCFVISSSVSFGRGLMLTVLLLGLYTIWGPQGIETAIPPSWVPNRGPSTTHPQAGSQSPLISLNGS